MPDPWLDKREIEHARALLGHTDSRVTLAHYRAAPERVKPVR